MLRVAFHLAGCRSLKEKRGRLRGLKDRFGKQSQVAVAEADLTDEHQRAVWDFVAVASDARVVEQTLTRIENDLALKVDAVITHIDRIRLD